MTSTTDRTLQEWRAALSALGGQLVDLESDATVAMARAGGLTGATAQAWTDADAGIGHAWQSYQALDGLLDDAEAAPARAGSMLSAATVPTAAGPADPSTAIAAARVAVVTAEGVVARLAVAWDHLAPRTATAHAGATAAGDTDTARTAAALAELLAHDPYAVTEADVVAVEDLTAKATGRRSASATAVARLDIDLTHARAELDALDAEVQTAGAELAHAAERIAGVDATVPVHDLEALGVWLGRIETTAGRDPARAAADLDDWAEAARHRRQELDRTLEPARQELRRREDGRGLWTALRAKAGARRLDEDQGVTAALDAARDLLWSAPCDLAAAEAALLRLAGLLDPSRPAPSDRPEGGS